jgi:hypothetical protein
MNQKQTNQDNLPINGFDTFNDAILSTAITKSIDF